MDGARRAQYLAAILCLTLAVPGLAQPRPASLRVAVGDSTGAVIVGARVEITGAGDQRLVHTTNQRGTAVLAPLAPGRWMLRVSSPGFDDFVEPALSLRSGSNSFDVVLQIAAFADEVVVTRDPREAATDPHGSSMTVTLTEDDLAGLPDSEEELRMVLDELAGPGADFEVDGFTDGSLPSRDEIQEVRIRRVLYSADRHGRGGSRIEIVRRPGLDRWRSSVSFAFRDESMNARNAFAPQATPEQHRRVSASLQGPLFSERTSMALSVEDESSYESPTIRAASPTGLVRGVARRPQEQLDLSLRLSHAISPTQSLQLEYRDRNDDERNLGVGDFDLPERAYARTRSRRRLRLGNSGTFANRLLNDVRVQASWEDTSNRATSDARTIRVLDSQTLGGANVRGGRSESSVQVNDNLSFRWRTHAVSVGTEVAWATYHSDEIRNASGTFTFSSLEDFEAGRPRTFTQRRGDPTVRYSMFQGAWFVQDDIRFGKSLTVGVGVRNEWQSQIEGHWHLGPRAGFSWAVTPDGRTTLRGGVGVFHDWYGASTYEETLQVDGRRVEELTIQSPSFPDPFLDGEPIVLPNGRVQAADGLEMPTIRQATLAAERRLGPTVRVNAGYTFRDGVNLLRGRNVNAPGPDGSRPAPGVGNVVEIRSIGRERAHEISTGISGRVPWRSVFLTGRYTWGTSRDDGGGALALPANNAAPDEWGPSSGDVRHRFSAFGGIDVVSGVQLGVNLRAESAPPYTITTGFDDNGDTVFNDRPEGVGRNTARGEGMFRMDLRLSWRLGVGERGRAATAQRGGGGTEGGRRAGRRVTAEVYARAYNLLNSVNRRGFSGVMTSPFFGLPRAAQSARRTEVGTRIRF